jgi:hypothetical protein
VTVWWRDGDFVGRSGDKKCWICVIFFACVCVCVGASDTSTTWIKGLGFWYLRNT